jgi:DNA invertase Pin-like site-specific DNA recombinase
MPTKRESDALIEGGSSEQRALGYIRVSTEEQARDGNGLMKQIARIQQEAFARGLTLIGIYEDIGSAVGSGSFYARSDLQGVISAAKREGIPIIVSKLDRLSREPKSLNGILNLDSVEIISCEPKEMRSRRSRRLTAKKAKLTAKNISEGTRRAFKERKDRGEKFGYPETLVEGRKSSIRVRKLRSAEIVDNVAIFINRTPGLVDRTAQEIAEALNKGGIKTSQGMSWHKDNIREVLRRAKKLIDEWNVEELVHEKEDATTGPAPVEEPSHGQTAGVHAPMNSAGPRSLQPINQDWGLVGPAAVAAQLDSLDESLSPEEEARLEEEERQRMKSNPNWGRF